MPAFVAASVLDLTPGWLAERGLRGLILDLDNTLTPWHGEDVEDATIEWVRSLRAADVRMCIASNTHRPARLGRLAARLEIAHAPAVAKPGKAGFQRALRLIERSVGETGVVGDQLLTDVLGGNRCGMLTVLVAPLSRREFIGTRLVSRTIESLLLRYFGRKGWLVSLPAGSRREA